MLVNSDAETNQNGSDEDQSLTAADLHILKGFRQLSEEHQNDILRFLDVLLNAQ